MKVNGEDILIEIGASTSKTAKNIRELTDEMRKLSKEIPKQSLRNLKQIFGNGKFIDTKNLKEQADSAEKSINRTKRTLSSFWDAFKGKAKEVSIVDPMKFEKQLNSIDKAIDRTKKKIDEFKSGLSAETSVDGGGDTAKINSFNSAIKEQERILEGLQIQRQKLAQSGGEGSQERFANALNKVRDAARKAGSSVLRFSKNIVLAPFKSAGDKVSAFAKKISGLGASIKRVAFYRTIRTAIKEIDDAFRVGTENLYFYSQGIGGEFAKSMDMAATSMLYFKNSIGAAVAPIVNALAPVLDMLVDKIVDVINVVNQLISKLTGATYWTKAIKHPVEYKEAVEDAGKAAKEALRYLAPFDELNILPSEKIGKGRAASAAEDYSAMFEEVTEYNKNISDFAKNLKAAIKRSDWAGVGRLLGEKVNSVINKIDFAGIGKKVGSGINSWFTAKYWTLKTINFTNIGKKISTFLNNAIGSINFETIGRSIVRVFTAGLDFAIGFLTELDLGQIGESISNFLIGAINEATEWLKSKDWSQIGKKLGNAVLEFFKKVDWAGLANSFFEFLGAAISAVSDFAVSFVFGLGDIKPSGNISAKSLLPFVGGALVAAGILAIAPGGGFVLKAALAIGATLLIKKAFFDVDEDGLTLAEGFTADAIGAVFEKLLEKRFKNNPPKASVYPEITVEKPKNWDFSKLLGNSLQESYYIDFIAKPKAKLKNGDIVSWAKEIVNSIKKHTDKNPLEVGAKVKLVDVLYYMQDTKWDSEKGEWVEIPGVLQFKQVMWQGLDLLKNKVPEVVVNGVMTAFGFKKGVKNEVDATANFVDANSSKLPVGKKIINAIASFVETRKDKLSKAARTIDVIAQYKKAFASSLSKAAKTINTIASFGKTDKSKLTVEQKTIASTANISKVKISVKRPVINITGNIDKITTKGGGDDNANVIEIKKNGGVFSNGKWKPINAYAGGGSPLSGEVFLAREAGPELVGRMGSNTAVMNNNQIVASVSDGVAVANEAVVGALFSAAAQIVSAIREQDRNGGGNAGIDTIARAVTRWQRNAAIANGV